MSKSDFEAFLKENGLLSQKYVLITSARWSLREKDPNWYSYNFFYESHVSLTFRVEAISATLFLINRISSSACQWIFLSSCVRLHLICIYPYMKGQSSLISGFSAFFMGDSDGERAFYVMNYDSIAWRMWIPCHVVFLTMSIISSYHLLILLLIQHLLILFHLYRLFRYIHIGLVQVGVNPLTRLGLNKPICLILRDTWHLNFEDSILGIILQNWKDLLGKQPRTFNRTWKTFKFTTLKNHYRNWWYRTQRFPSNNLK